MVEHFVEANAKSQKKESIRFSFCASDLFQGETNRRPTSGSARIQCDIKKVKTIGVSKFVAWNELLPGKASTIDMT